MADVARYASGPGVRTALNARRARHVRSAPRTKLDVWPRRTWLRWVVRLAFTAPGIALAVISSPTATAIATPNQALLDHLADIPWDRADAIWLGEIYPPISTLLAAAVAPFGGRLALGILGAVVAGIFIQKLVEIMIQRDFSLALTVTLTLALTANPLFMYTVTENFAATLGLAFFGLAVTDVVRFVAWRDTRAGFRAGLFLMLATLSDLTAIAYVLPLALAAPFLRLGRHGQRGARWANVLVIVYPTLAAIAAMLLLTWAFSGNPIGTLGEQLSSGYAERFATLGPLFTTPTGWLLAAPVLSAWLVALIVRRPGSILVSTIVFVAILAAYVGGLLPSGSAGNTFILMTMMAIALVPRPKTRIVFAALDGVALLQLAIAWLAAADRAIVVEWMRALASGLGLA
ncbi:MAG: hypothetical protein J0G30_13600 [Actinomycetales bacterium]|nr:hypothetical protein [Actinomycetales bacterium]